MTQNQYLDIRTRAPSNEDGHCEHSEFSGDAESNSWAQGRFWNQPLGAAMGAGPPQGRQPWRKEGCSQQLPA